MVTLLRIMGADIVGMSTMLTFASARLVNLHMKQLLWSKGAVQDDPSIASTEASPISPIPVYPVGPDGDTLEEEP